MHSYEEWKKAVKLYNVYQKCVQRKVNRAEVWVSNTVSTDEVVLAMERRTLFSYFSM